MFALTAPDLQVSGWLIAITAAMIGVFLLLAVGALLSVRRRPVEVGSESLVGRTGIVESDVTPLGTVRVQGEVWQAESDEPGLIAGQQVRVVSVDGVILNVRKS